MNYRSFCPVHLLCAQYQLSQAIIKCLSFPDGIVSLMQVYGGYYYRKTEQGSFMKLSMNDFLFLQEGVWPGLRAMIGSIR